MADDLSPTQRRQRVFASSLPPATLLGAILVDPIGAEPGSLSGRAASLWGSGDGRDSAQDRRGTKPAASRRF